MKTDKNYTFSVSISKDRYRNKQQATAAIVGGEDGRLMRKNCGLSEKIGFQTTSVTAEELLLLQLLWFPRTIVRHHLCKKR